MGTSSSGSSALEALDGENPNRRAVLAAFGVALVGVLIGAVLVDVIAGRADEAPAAEGGDSLFLADQELGWANRPDWSSEELAIAINSLGLRGPALPAPDAAVDELRREPRVLICGASNVFGLGAPEELTWRARLQSEFAAATEPAPRFINGGVQGYSLVQGARRATRLAVLLEPDVIILEVFPGRQALLDSSPAAKWTRVGDEIVPTDVVEGWPTALRAIPARAHRALMNSYFYRRSRPKIQFGGAADQSTIDFMLTDAPIPGSIAPAVEQARAELTALARFCEERGIDLRLALLIEPRFSADEHWNNYLESAAARGAPPAGTPKEEPPAAMLRWLEPTGATVWDMSATMYAIGAGWEELVQAANLHWSGKGHGLVAAEWARLLRAEGLLESAAARRVDRPRSEDAALGAGGEAILELDLKGAGGEGR